MDPSEIDLSESKNQEEEFGNSKEIDLKSLIPKIVDSFLWLLSRALFFFLAVWITINYRIPLEEIFTASTLSNTDEYQENLLVNTLKEKREIRELANRNRVSMQTLFNVVDSNYSLDVSSSNEQIDEIRRLNEELFRNYSARSQVWNQDLEDSIYDYWSNTRRIANEIEIFVRNRPLTEQVYSNIQVKRELLDRIWYRFEIEFEKNMEKYANGLQK